MVLLTRHNPVKIYNGYFTLELQLDSVNPTTSSHMSNLNGVIGIIRLSALKNLLPF